MSLDRCGERAAKHCMEMPWAGNHNKKYFQGKVNITIIEMQVGIENRVDGGKKGFGIKPRE